MTAPVVVPRLAIDAPPAPTPHDFGLFVAATVLENAQPRELTGVEYQAVSTVAVNPYPAPCRPDDPPLPRRKFPVKTLDVFNGTPFALEASTDCVLGLDEAVVRKALRQRFTAGEETALEHVMSTGALGNWPHLAAPILVDTSSALELTDAIGLLDTELCLQYGGVGVLHCPMTIAGRTRYLDQVRVVGPRALTFLGSTWVYGAGYTGEPPPLPGLVDDGMTWLYATPPIRIRRTALIEPATWEEGAFDRPTNRAMVIVERMYVIDWPGPAWAVKTNVKRPGWTPPSGAAAPVQPAGEDEP